MKSKIYFPFFKFSLMGLAFILITFYAFDSLAQNQIEGVWKSTDGKYMMKISSLGDEYYGRIVWLENPSMLDVKNPDEKLSKLPVKGSKILEELTYKASKSRWTDGRLYIPEQGEYYKCEVSIEGDHLKIHYQDNTQSAKTWQWKKQ